MESVPSSLLGRHCFCRRTRSARTPRLGSNCLRSELALGVGNPGEGIHQERARCSCSVPSTATRAGAGALRAQPSGGEEFARSESVPGTSLKGEAKLDWSSESEKGVSVQAASGRGAGALWRRGLIRACLLTVRVESSCDEPVRSRCRVRCCSRIWRRSRTTRAVASASVWYQCGANLLDPRSRDLTRARKNAMWWMPPNLSAYTDLRDAHRERLRLQGLPGLLRPDGRRQD